MLPIQIKWKTKPLKIPLYIFGMILLSASQCVYLVFLGYDLLKEFRLVESRGVKQVKGSEPESVAYRINPSLHLRKSLRYCIKTKSSEIKCKQASL